GPEAPARLDPPGPPAARRPSPTPEFPLRTPEHAAPLDPPPVPIPPAPPPLVVRRTVDLPRPAGGPTSPGAARHGSGRTRPAAPPTPALDFDADVESGPEDVHAGGTLDGFDDDGAGGAADTAQPSRLAAGADAAGPGARVCAGLVDAGLLLGIDLLVVWLTL